MQTVGECVFSQEIEGLPEAMATETVELADGETFALTTAPVRKRIGDAEVRMLAYNGSVPGPVLRVQQGATVEIDFTNGIDLESTVHWHGLRLDNRFDGTHETQAPVQPGESFRYRVTFPDPGLYWYHPHIREDYGQELGLAGTVLVEPTETDYWAPVNREVVLTLDDILLEDGKIALFRRDETNYVAMGRFGNTLLVNGETQVALDARRGEVIRFYLVNTANTRTFNVGFREAQMKLVGGDSGRVERERCVETVMLAPSERVIVEVLFDQPGTVTLEHRTPGKTYAIGTVTVGEEAAQPSFAEAFATLRTDPELAAERQGIDRYLAAEPDRTLAFVAEMNMEAAEEGETTYVCPMHPEITSDAPASCPICGMKLLPASLAGGMGHSAHGHHGHMDHGAMMHEDHGGHEMHAAMDHHAHGHHAMDHAGHHAQHEHHSMQEHDAHHGHQAMDHGMHVHDHAASDGIEWEDDMEAVNRLTTPANTRWTIVDRTTGAANHAIDWHLTVGDRVKIRLVNEMESDHPMHHPFHIHGAGRFLILSRNGAAEPNLAWKDTVLVRTGETVDILLDVTNPGVWMAHCHIAEHHESGMMFSFHVTP